MIHAFRLSLAHLLHIAAPFLLLPAFPSFLLEEPPFSAAADPPSRVPVSGPTGQMDGGFGPLGWSTAGGCSLLRGKKTAPVKFLCVVSCSKKKTTRNHLNFPGEVGRKQAATGMVAHAYHVKQDPSAHHTPSNSPPFIITGAHTHTHTCALYLEFYVYIFSDS